MGPLKLLLTLRSRGIGMPSSSVTCGQTQHINVLELTALFELLAYAYRYRGSARREVFSTFLIAKWQQRQPHKALLFPCP